ncbi:hypothetical protein OUZ56_021337 [Daphnia magna]|uniref:Uncharacterized protein n=1 Tax=Daphnia magna TaxID=35525 RepID=A0ABQ9ZH47_9CRUS|nr:hypothetical protein OUZ56_021337 [Daphnia magna]
MEGTTRDKNGSRLAVLLLQKGELTRCKALMGHIYGDAKRTTYLGITVFGDCFNRIFRHCIGYLVVNPFYVYDREYEFLQI